MLIKLAEEQISTHWDSIKETLVTAVPDVDVNEDHAQKILEKLMFDSMQCWVYLAGTEVKALVLTIVQENNILLNKQLYIYALHSFTTLAPQDWKIMFDSVNKYAQAKQCVQITALTNNPTMLNMARSFFNADTTYSLVTINVEALDG